MLKNFITVLLFISLLFLIQSCFDTPKEPITPTWDIELNIPVGNKTFSIKDIVEKKSQISIVSPSRILKFSTEKIQKDTTLDFLLSNTLDMEADTSLPVIGTGFEFNMIVAKDSIRMDSADIQDGEVKFRIRNNNPFQVFVNIVFPGFTRRVGVTIDTFKISTNVQANQTVQVSVPINNYKYKQPSNQPFGATRPGVWIKIGFSSSVIGTGQTLDMIFQIENLRFRNFAGLVKPLDLGPKSQTVKNDLSGDLKGFIKGVTFEQAYLTRNALTTIQGYDVLLKGFQIIGKYKNGSPPIYLLFDGINYKDMLIPAGQEVIEVFSTINTNVNQFINAAPDSIEVKAVIVLNPQYKSGLISSTDKVYFSVQIETYSKMKIENSIVTDTAEVDWEQNTKDKISKGNDALLQIDINNGLPFDIQFVGYFLDKNKNKLFYYTRQTGIGSSADTVINISAASINANGEVTAPRNSTIRLSLSKVDFEKFKNVAAMVNRFKISSAQNQSVIVNADNFVKVKVFGKINYRVNK